MKSYKELLQTETFWTTKIQNELYQAVINYIEENKINRTQFAKKLGVTKGYLSQVLNGDFNHRLSKLVELSLAIGIAPIIHFEDLENYITKSEAGFKPINKVMYFSRKCNFKELNSPIDENETSLGRESKDSSNAPFMVSFEERKGHWHTGKRKTISPAVTTASKAV